MRNLFVNFNFAGINPGNPLISTALRAAFSLFVLAFAVTFQADAAKPFEPVPQERFRVKGYVVDAKDKVVGPVRVKAMNADGVQFNGPVSGQFSIKLPAGRYSFDISDGNGNFHRYTELEVRSATSIKFMFSTNKRISEPTADFRSSSTQISIGQSADISWKTTDAESVSINNGIGSVDKNGSLRVSPTSSTNYTITVSNRRGEVSKTIRVAVSGINNPEPTASFSSSTGKIKAGDSVRLSWNTNDADSVRINNGIGIVAASGSVSVSPLSSNTYTLTASGDGGTVTRNVTINVAGGGGDRSVPTASFSASSTKIDGGQSVTLSWNTTGAGTVRIDPDVGVVGKSGSIILKPASSKTYTLTASNGNGITKRSLSIGVDGVVPDNGDDIDNEIVPDEVEDDSDETAPTPESSPAAASEEAPAESANGGDGGDKGWSWPAVFALTLLGIGGLIGVFALAASIFPALVPWVVGAFGGLGLAGAVSSEGDEVHCTLYTQPEISAGSQLLVQVFAHLLEQEDELDELAAENDPEAKKQKSEALKKRIKRESVLTFKLMMPGIELFEDEDEIVWNGEPDSIEFIIPIPDDLPPGKRFGRITVFSNGEKIGKIPFRINVMPLALQLDRSAKPPEVGGIMTQNEFAFVSYASKDKDKVYRFVQLMDVLKYKYHIDIFHIEAGDRWEQKLYEFISTDDVFLLFWSKSASESHWVNKEAQLAKERMSKDPKGLPRIIIYALDEEVQIPDYLSDIHVDRKWAEIIGSVEEQISAPGE